MVDWERGVRSSVEDNAGSYFLVGVNPVADGVVARMSPMENTNINISLELFNAKSYVQYAYVGVRAVSGEAVRYWNVSTGMWETVHSDGASMKKEIARSDVGDVNEFYPLNNLSSQTFQFNITSVPKWEIQVMKWLIYTW